MHFSGFLTAVIKFANSDNLTYSDITSLFTEILWVLDYWTGTWIWMTSCYPNKFHPWDNTDNTSQGISDMDTHVSRLCDHIIPSKPGRIIVSNPLGF